VSLGCSKDLIFLQNITLLILWTAAIEIHPGLDPELMEMEEEQRGHLTEEFNFAARKTVCS